MCVVQCWLDSVQYWLGNDKYTLSSDVDVCCAVLVR